MVSHLGKLHYFCAVGVATVCANPPLSFLNGRKRLSSWSLLSTEEYADKSQPHIAPDPAATRHFFSLLFVESQKIAMFQKLLKT